MCTVSVIAIRGPSPGLRVVCNRDEAWDRADAEVPRWRDVPGTTGATRAIWPTDLRAGGTWIAANSRGLVLVVLNLNMEPRPSLPPRESPASRGLLIPGVAGEPDSGSVADHLGRWDLSHYAPFRLVALGPHRGAIRGVEMRWDRARLTRREFDGTPACFVSSGLGDSKVLPRLSLFDEVVGAGATADAQDRFHHHAWPDRPEVSVLMHRREARTVSITTVSVGCSPGGPRVEMQYMPVPPPGEPADRERTPPALAAPAR